MIPLESVLRVDLVPCEVNLKLRGKWPPPSLLTVLVGLDDVDVTDAVSLTVSE
jgi:hypothetical protein